MVPSDIPTEHFNLVTAFAAVGAVISFLITVPLVGILLRVRANYVPKPLQLDTEASERADVVDNSYFGMMRRVIVHEGWSGLYKGIWATLLASLVAGLVALLSQNQFTGGLPPPPALLASFRSQILLFLINLPFTVLVYRSVVTPYKLSFSRWSRNLKTLFTNDERRHFWKLYTAPGLLLALFLRTVISGLVLLLASYTLHHTVRWNTLSPLVRMIVYAVSALAFTAIETPLEVVIAKLAIQRNGSDSTVDEAVKYPGEEDVIRFRDEQAPYKGFVDCIKKIIQEEGGKALFRCWYITLLGNVLSVFALLATVIW